MALLAFLLFLPALAAYCDETDDAINAAIRQEGAAWVAGRTSVSGLSADEKRRLASLQVPPGFVEPVVEALPRAASVPSAVDWKSRDGGSYVTPVRDQKTCGACWAFAATAALESRVLIDGMTPDRDIDLSEQVLISCDSASSGCNGGWPYNASAFIQKNGLPPESCYPYASSGGVCGGACADWQKIAYRVDSYQGVARSVDALRAAIAGGPVHCALYIFEDFLHYKSGIYRHVTGNYYGLHAAAVVGYDDAGQYFIAKNSWGTGWGEAGFFRIAYSEVGSATMFGYAASSFGKIVLPEASFVLTPAALDFGTLTLPDEPSKDLTVTVVNGGLAPISGMNVNTTGRPFSAQPSSIDSLDPGASKGITVTYSASQGTAGDSGSLDVSCNGVTQSVGLTGASNAESLPHDPPAADSGGGGGGCFIATAAYGASAWQVDALRRFRDSHLLTNGAGRLAVAAYYAVSPRLAACLDRHPAFKPAVRLLLSPIALCASFPRASGLVVLLAAACLALTMVLRRFTTF